MAIRGYLIAEPFVQFRRTEAPEVTDLMGRNTPLARHFLKSLGMNLKYAAACWLFRVGSKPGTEIACCSFPFIADFADVRRFTRHTPSFSCG